MQLFCMFGNGLFCGFLHLLIGFCRNGSFSKDFHLDGHGKQPLQQVLQLFCYMIPLHNFIPAIFQGNRPILPVLLHFRMVKKAVYNRLFSL